MPARSWPVNRGSEPGGDLQRRHEGPVGVVGQGSGDAEDGHQSVAEQLVGVASVALDRRDDDLEEFIERGDHVFRGGVLRELGESDDVDEHDSDVGGLTGNLPSLLGHSFGDRRVDVGAERGLQFGSLLQPADHLVELFGELPEFVVR
jgi:hypothetical protein